MIICINDFTRDMLTLKFYINKKDNLLCKNYYISP